jgi:histidine ammonia-lyase
LEFRAPLQPGKGVKQARDVVRKYIAPLTSDRAMSTEVERLAQVLRDGEFDVLA